MLSRRSLWAALLFCSLASPSLADDGLAAFRNGALVFGKSKTIAMVEETLTVSRSTINADFHFVNKGPAPETVTVAFPLPDIDTASSDGLYIPVPDSDNFVGFTTEVEGKPVAHGLEQRAFAPDGSDVTAELKALNIPLVRAYWTYVDLFKTLPKNAVSKLIESHAVAGEPGDLSPQWITKSKFYFEQTFEPGKSVHIVHSYKPSLDISNMSFYSGDMQPSPEQNHLFCLNDDVKKAVQTLEKTKAGSDYPYATQATLSYILSTARTWSGPIGRFHLIVDIEKPEAIASFCGKFKRISPTRSEFEAENFVPDRDLDIAIFE